MTAVRKDQILTLSEVVALANVLQIAPSELTRLPVPAPANGRTDSAIKAVRCALRDAGHGWPRGQVLPVDALRARVAALVTDLAQAELDAITVPTTSPESMQRAGILALCQSLVAAVGKRPADVAAPLELASELAERTGEARLCTGSITGGRCPGYGAAVMTR